ncbi:MAG: type IV toxin-antitoxin system AbiEi family antitoxin, partial [Verrucomicrobia bacterium]|nr:type IV toxin-antitoxin system AbiEi family antitoxin [Verrucomicrobiota bacterium]
GFLEKKSPRQFRLRDPLALLDAWVKADDFARRNTTTRYTVFGGAPLEKARQLKSWADQQSVRIAFTQWVAGWLRHPYTEPVIASAYVARLPEAATLERLSLRSVNDAGKVWLYVADDDGVFLETQTVQDLPLVSDAQIYLDLQQTGLRGPDQANALRNWEGFCRP